MINIIAAIGENNELGFKNDLIWDLPEDLKFFKEKTNGKTIVMGRNTFISLGRMLPNRKHIVITHSHDLPDEVLVFDNLEDVLKYIEDIDDVFIIGGASIYKQFLEYADNLYLTEIEDSKEADVYFPDFDKNNYNKKILLKKKENGVNYKHVLYERK